MRKIQTVFVRDPEDRRRLLAQTAPGCEWVLAGEGRATRKRDGTCVRWDGERWWARREVKAGRPVPSGFEVVEADPLTSKVVGFEPAEHSGFWRWLEEAAAELDGARRAAETFELCGPKVNGNPEGLDRHRLFAHGAEDAPAVVRGQEALTFEGLRAALLGPDFDGVEGVVWYGDGGQRAKLKRRDFQ